MQQRAKKYTRLSLQCGAILLLMTNCSYDNSIDSYGNTTACELSQFEKWIANGMPNN